MGCRKLDISQNYESVLTVVGKSLTTEKLQVEHFWKTKKMGVNYYPFHSIMPGRSFNSSEYRYGGAGGQEKDDEITGVTGSHYTAEFWEYDSRTGRRWNLDPKPSSWESGYATFRNNPLTYVDMLGDTPTVAEAAIMQDFTYNLREGYTGSISGSTLGGWNAMSMASDKETGFKSALFGRDLGEGKMEYAYVFAGTDDKGDVKTDFGLYTEEQSQMKSALSYARQYSKDYAGSELTFVGHSLGGWLASGAAMKTGNPAITFNAPGISSRNRTMYGLNKSASITAYVVDGEALNFNLSGFGLGASGNTTILKADYSFITALRWAQRIENHKIGTVINKLKEEGMWQYKGKTIPIFPKPANFNIGIVPTRQDNLR